MPRTSYAHRALLPHKPLPLPAVPSTAGATPYLWRDQYPQFAQDWRQHASHGERAIQLASPNAIR